MDLLSEKEYKISEERVKHMHGVAEYMYVHAKEYNLDAEEMYLLGLLHDIGYVQGFKKGHEKYGARLCFDKLLRDNTNLVYCIEYHSQIPTNFTWTSELCRQQYLLLEADMVINSKGEHVGFNRRLKEIGKKNGYDSEDYKNCVNLIKWLKMQKNHAFYKENEKIIKPMGDSQTIAWKCFEHIPMEYRDFALFLFSASDFEIERAERQKVKRIVEVSGLLRDLVMEELECNQNDITIGLVSLCKVGFLKPTSEPSIYEINPVFDMKNIRQISEVYSDIHHWKMYWPEEESKEENKKEDFPKSQCVFERHWELYNRAI